MLSPVLCGYLPIIYHKFPLGEFSNYLLFIAYCKHFIVKHFYILISALVCLLLRNAQVSWREMRSVVRGTWRDYVSGMIPLSLASLFHAVLKEMKSHIRSSQEPTYMQEQALQQKRRFREFSSGALIYLKNSINYSGRDFVALALQWLLSP